MSGRLGSAPAWGAVASIAAANAALYLSSGQGSLSVLYRYLVIEFGWSRARLGSIGTVTLLLAGVLGVVAGAACDRFGPRRVVTVGSLSVALGCGLAAAATGLAFLYAFALCMALAQAAMGFAPAQLVVSRGFARQRGLAMGIATAGISLGGLVGPLATSGLAEATSWRAAYGVYAAIALLAAPLVAWQLGGIAMPTEPAGRRPGGLTRLRTVLRQREFWFPTLALAAMLYAVVAIAQHWVLMQQDRGMAATEAAGLLTLYYAAGLAGRFVFGPLYDRYAPARVGRVQALIMAALLALLWLPDVGWVPLSYALLFGLGYGGFLFLAPLLLGERYAGHPELGTIVGAAASVSAILYSTAPAVAGWLFDATGSYAATIGLAVTMALIAAGLVHRCGEPGAGRGP